VRSLFLCCPLLLIGCDGFDNFLDDSSGPSTATIRSVCNRMDECGSLTGSVETCVADTKAGLADLSLADTIICEVEFNDCLTRDTCEEFLFCDVSFCLAATVIPD